MTRHNYQRAQTPAPGDLAFSKRGLEPTTYYEVVYWENLNVWRFRNLKQGLSADTNSCSETIADVVSLLGNPKDYVVAIEDGVMRQLTEGEQAEVDRLRRKSG